MSFKFLLNGSGFFFGFLFFTVNLGSVSGRGDFFYFISGGRGSRFIFILVSGYVRVVSFLVEFVVWTWVIFSEGVFWVFTCEFWLDI